MSGGKKIIARGIAFFLVWSVAAEERVDTDTAMRKARCIAAALEGDLSSESFSIIKSPSAADSYGKINLITSLPSSQLESPAVPTPIPAEISEPSPWEDLKNAFKDHIVAPAVSVYHLIVPEEIRGIFSRIFDNLKSWGRAINHLFQGHFDQAGVEVARFAVNSTLGVGGVFDWAGDMGLEKKETSFDQTLGAWGVEASVARDIVGSIVDVAFNPTTYLLAPIAGIAFHTASVVAAAPEE